MNYEHFALQNESAIRITAFCTVLFVMALWEIRSPSRVLEVPRSVRWRSNLGVTVLNSLLVRLVVPLGAVGAARWVAENQWGVLGQLQLPLWLAMPVAIVALDFVIWLQHVLVHAVPLFWRVHQVHHADLDFDVTTGTRFHPIEIVFSTLVKIAAITLLGPPVVAVMLFELILNATSLFNHSNVRIPAHADRLLRWLVVTPDMHRVHHSVLIDESNTNFGFSLPWWDRLFGTYRNQPQGGHIGMRIGLNDYREPQIVSRLGGLLYLPFERRRTLTKTCA